MPKMKTNRMARKKFRKGGTGTIKKARANTSHNTGKQSSKRSRQLRGRTTVHGTNQYDVQRMLTNI